MDLAGKRLLISRDINFSQLTMAFDRLFETILFTDKHDRSLVSSMTRNDSIRFATLSQRCKERRTSRAVYELVTELVRYNMGYALSIGRAEIESPSF